jgi:hypothetical protein
MKTLIIVTMMLIATGCGKANSCPSVNQSITWECVNAGDLTAATNILPQETSYQCDSITSGANTSKSVFMNIEIVTPKAFSAIRQQYENDSIVATTEVQCIAK